MKKFRIFASIKIKERGRFFKTFLTCGGFGLSLTEFTEAPESLSRMLSPSIQLKQPSRCRGITVKYGC